MLSWFHAIMPKEEQFFALFSRHAQTLVLGSAALRQLLEGGPDVAECCERIIRHEHEADLIARETLQAMRRSFITPFDRSDIKGLTNSLDDAIDQMHKTAKAITLFEVTQFEPKMREMGDIIALCAERTRDGVAMLNAMKANAGPLHDYTEAVIQLEERADGIHDQGLKELFLKSRGGDAMGFIVGQEIYSHLEKVVDRFEDVANRVSGLLIEHL